MDIINIKKIRKVYKTDINEVVALDGIDLFFSESELVFIDGVSGSGKTTLINILTGIDKMTGGELFIFGRNMTNASAHEWDLLRNRDIGIVFQNYNLFEDLSVYENVLLSLKKIDIPDKEKVIEETLEYVGIGNYKNRKCIELSAGQKQRVAIARALIKNPKIIFADEATSNLDPVNSDNILKLFDKISKDRLVVLVSHDKNAAINYADRIISLADGKIIKDTDNKKLKELHSDEYGVNINVNGMTKTARLKNFELKTELLDFIKWKENRIEDLKASIEIFQDVKKEKHIFQDDKRETESKKLLLKDIIGMSKRWVHKSKIKMFMVIFLMLFFFTVFMSMMFIGLNDYDDVLYRYTKKSNNEYLKIRKTINDNVICNGLNFSKELSEIFENNIIKYTGNEDITVGSKQLENIDIYKLDNANMFKDFLHDGEKIEHREAIISETIQKECNVRIGDEFEYCSVVFKIAGVSDRYIYNNKKYIVINNEDCVKMWDDNNFINLQGMDITKSMSKKEFYFSIQRIGKDSLIDSNCRLLWGRTIQNENEFMISRSLAEERFGGDYDKIIKEYRLPNLFDGKYEEYSGVLNLYDYMGKKVNLVGIYDSDNIKANIIVDGNIFNKLVEDYNSALSYEAILVPQKMSRKQIEKIGKKYYQIDEIDAEPFYTYKGINDKIKKYLFVLMVAMFIIIILLLTVFLGYGITDEINDIGIYRIIGYSKSDIRKYVYLVNISLVVVAVIISNVFTFGVKNIINNSIKTYLDIKNIDIFAINVNYQLVVSLLIILLSIIITEIFVRLLLSKQIVKLIYKR